MVREAKELAIFYCHDMACLYLKEPRWFCYRHVPGRVLAYFSANVSNLLYTETQDIHYQKPRLDRFI